MKKALLPLIVILTLALSACATAAAPEAVPTVVLEPAESASAAQSGASAVVVPVEKIELSFPLTGIVKTVEVEEGDQVKAGDTLATLDTAVLEARVREAEAAVVTEETQLAYIIRTQIDNERLEAAKADIARAQAGVDILKAQIAQATLAAPITATVASVEISPAEVATPGQIVIVLGDLTRFQIETTDLSEKNVPGIEIGQSAQVYIEALDETFSGKVADIARISETVGGDVVFKVTIELDEQPEGLRWGMSADVKIESE